MSVEPENRTMVGWKVDDPGEVRECIEHNTLGRFSDKLKEMAEWLNSKYFYDTPVDAFDDLVVEISPIQDEGWVIGVPLPDGAIRMDILGCMLEELDGAASEVYECVFDETSEDPSYLIRFEQAR